MYLYVLCIAVTDCTYHAGLVSFDALSDERQHVLHCTCHIYIYINDSNTIRIISACISAQFTASPVDVFLSSTSKLTRHTVYIV